MKESDLGLGFMLRLGLMCAIAFVVVVLWPFKIASVAVESRSAGHADNDVKLSGEDEDVIWLYDANGVASTVDSGDSFAWEPQKCKEITIDCINVSIDLLNIVDCNDAELMRFTLFMQLVSSFSPYTDATYQALVDKLVSPKLRSKR